MTVPLAEKIACLVIERWRIADLKPHPRNPRAHAQPGSDKWNVLEASLVRDYFDPLVVNRRNGMLVSGHFRLKVLTHLGYTHADVSVVDYTEAEHYARMIAANELLGKWEDELLAALARDIDTAGIAASLAGWTDAEMAAQLDGGQVDDDTENAVALASKADDLQREWAVKPGELFQVGPHRVFCGDCRSATTWQALLDGRKADMIWTDPPYNVDYEGKAGGMQNDHLSASDYGLLLITAFARGFEITKAGGAIYVAHADSEGLANRQACAHAGWSIKQTLVWVKNAATLTRQDYHWQHEPILYGWKPGAGHYWQGGFSLTTVIDDDGLDLGKLDKRALIDVINRLRNDRETTVIREARNAVNALHPTVKPLPLVARHIHNSSRKGELVADLFAGSGTTLVAADQTGRCAVAPELEPKFCAVVLQRMKDRGHTPERIPYEADAAQTA